METNTRKCKVIVKTKRIDDWIDQNGFLHTTFTKEVIRGPITTGPETSHVRLDQIIPRLMMSKINLPGFHQHPIPGQAQKQQQQTPPMMDMAKLMQMGKTLLDANGINLKDIFCEVTGQNQGSKTEESTDEVEDDKCLEEIDDEDSEEPTEDEENTAKAYLDKMEVPETKPITDDKEVNKWQKTNKPQKNQKNKQKQLQKQVKKTTKKK